MNATGLALSLPDTFLIGASHTVKAVYTNIDGNFLGNNSTNLTQIVQTVAVEPDPSNPTLTDLFIGSNGATSNDHDPGQPGRQQQHGQHRRHGPDHAQRRQQPRPRIASPSPPSISSCKTATRTSNWPTRLTINAVVTAGNGNDNVQLGNGNNIVTLGNGNDNIQAGSGSNTVTAGNGNDNVQLGNGSNTRDAGQRQRQRPGRQRQQHGDGRATATTTSSSAMGPT